MRALRLHGWVLVRVNGSHHIFKCPGHAETVVVPLHRGDLGAGLLKSIEKKTGISLR